jgi:hypothetical protein
VASSPTKAGHLRTSNARLLASTSQSISGN